MIFIYGLVWEDCDLRDEGMCQVIYIRAQEIWRQRQGVLVLMTLATSQIDTRGPRFLCIGSMSLEISMCLDLKSSASLDPSAQQIPNLPL